MAQAIDPVAVLGGLRDAGLRITEPRREVVEAVCRWSAPFSADDVYAALHAAGSPTGRATVFRTIDLLVGLRFIGKIHRVDGSHGYVLRDPGHSHHLVCSSCGNVVEFHDCNVADLAKELAERTHFRIEGHWLEFFGLCADCQCQTGGQPHAVSRS